MKKLAILVSTLIMVFLLSTPSLGNSLTIASVCLYSDLGGEMPPDHAATSISFQAVYDIDWLFIEAFYATDIGWSPLTDGVSLESADVTCGRYILGRPSFGLALISSFFWSNYSYAVPEVTEEARTLAIGFGVKGSAGINDIKASLSWWYSMSPLSNFTFTVDDVKLYSKAPIVDLLRVKLEWQLTDIIGILCEYRQLNVVLDAHDWGNSSVGLGMQLSF